MGAAATATGIVLTVGIQYDSNDNGRTLGINATG